MLNQQSQVKHHEIIKLKESKWAIKGSQSLFSLSSLNPSPHSLNSALLNEATHYFLTVRTRPCKHYLVHPKDIIWFTLILENV